MRECFSVCHLLPVIFFQLTIPFHFIHEILYIIGYKWRQTYQITNMQYSTCFDYYIFHACCKFYLSVIRFIARIKVSCVQHNILGLIISSDLKTYLKYLVLNILYYFSECKNLSNLNNTGFSCCLRFRKFIFVKILYFLLKIIYFNKKNYKRRIFS